MDNNSNKKPGPYDHLLEPLRKIHNFLKAKEWDLSDEKPSIQEESAIERSTAQLIQLQQSIAEASKLTVNLPVKDSPEALHLYNELEAIRKDIQQRQLMLTRAIQEADRQELELKKKDELSRKRKFRGMGGTGWLKS
jgi:hypothetical protein